MYQQALQAKEKALGAEHTSTLETVGNLGILYWQQGKLAEVETMFQRALQGFKEALSAEHKSTLEAVGKLGIIYSDQGKVAEARIMFSKALVGYEKVMGSDHPRSRIYRDNLQALDTVADNEATEHEEEPVNNSQGETSYLGATPSKSKRYKLLKKLGLR